LRDYPYWLLAPSGSFPTNRRLQSRPCKWRNPPRRRLSLLTDRPIRSPSRADAGHAVAGSQGWPVAGLGACGGGVSSHLAAPPAEAAATNRQHRPTSPAREWRPRRSAKSDRMRTVSPRWPSCRDTRRRARCFRLAKPERVDGRPHHPVLSALSNETFTFRPRLGAWRSAIIAPAASDWQAEDTFHAQN
jgi:hypothetical protein